MGEPEKLALIQKMFDRYCTEAEINRRVCDLALVRRELKRLTRDFFALESNAGRGE